MVQPETMRNCHSPRVVSPGNNLNKNKPTSRIPNTLQAVFLASNRGREVHKPPPERVAYKEYFRNLWGSAPFSRNGSQTNSRFGSKRNSVAPSAKATPVVSPTNGRSKTSSILDSLGLPDAPLATPVKVQKKKKPRLPSLSPQQYLDAQCRSRGYSTERFGTLKTGYHNNPTPMQLASYDSYLISLVKQNQVDKIRRIYDSQLISANPCNQYGESLVHTTCRLGNATILKTLMDAGADLQVADDYGRTPLHDACWGAEPNFACVRLILDQNPETHPRLFFLTDARGAEPLTYVRREHWAAWIEFLESVKNQYWPKVGASPQAPPPLTQQAAHTRLIANPPHPKASTELARLIASGKMTPEEGLLLLTEDDDSEDDSCSEEEDDSDYSDSDDEEDSDDDEDGVEEVDTAEMKEFLRTVLPAEFTRAH